MSSEQHIINAKYLQEAQTDMMEYAGQISDSMPAFDLTERIERAKWSAELFGQRALVEATLALVEAQLEANRLAVDYMRDQA